MLSLFARNTTAVYLDLLSKQGRQYTLNLRLPRPGWVTYQYYLDIYVFFTEKDKFRDIYLKCSNGEWGIIFISSERMNAIPWCSGRRAVDHFLHGPQPAEKENNL